MTPEFLATYIVAPLVVLAVAGGVAGIIALNRRIASNRKEDAGEFAKALEKFDTRHTADRKEGEERVRLVYKELELEVRRIAGENIQQAAIAAERKNVQDDHEARLKRQETEGREFREAILRAIAGLETNLRASMTDIASATSRDHAEVRTRLALLEEMKSEVAEVKKSVDRIAGAN